MPFGAIAGAIGGISSIIGGNASADAADAASKRQAATAREGIDFQRQVLQQIQQYLTPYINAGTGGLNQLTNLTSGGPGTGVFQDPRQGPGAVATPPNQAFQFDAPTSGAFGQSPLSAIFGGSLGADPNTKMLSGALGATPNSALLGGAFGATPNSALMGGAFGKNPNDLTTGDFHHSPGYASSVQGGLEAIRNSASRTGGAVSGNALKALTGFGTQAANQDWQNYLDSYSKNFFNTANQYGTNFGNIANQYGSNFSNLASQYGNNFSNLGGLYGNQFANMANIYGNEADRYSNDYYKNVGINSGLSNDLFSKLQLIAGMGQNAASGGASPAISASSNIANSLTGLGNAQAGGIVGSNLATTQGINSGLTSILGGNALSGGGSGSSGGGGIGGLGALLSNLFSSGGGGGSASSFDPSSMSYQSLLYGGGGAGAGGNYGGGY